MSLLMDALRKAEQEKKEAKKRQSEEETGQDVSAGEDDRELTLAPNENASASMPADENEPLDTPLYAENDQIDWKQEDEDSSDLTLSPLGEEDASSDEADREAVSAEETGADKLTLEKSGLENDELASAGLDEYDEQDAIGPAGEREAPAVGEGAENGQDLEATQQDGRTFSETLSSDTEATHDETDLSVTAQTETEPDSPDSTTRIQPDGLAINTNSYSSRDPTINERIDIPGTGHGRSMRGQTGENTDTSSSNSLNQYSTSAAHNVFAASKHSSSTAWTIATLFSLVLVVLVAYGIFYYYSVTPLDRDIPSPTVARGVESDLEQQPIITEPVKPIDKSVASVDATPVLDEIEAGIKTEAIKSSDRSEPEPLDSEADSVQQTPTAAQTEVGREGDTSAARQTGPAEPAGTKAPAAPTSSQPASESVSGQTPDRDVTPAAATKPEREAGQQQLAMAQTGVEEPLELKPSLVKISRSKVPEHQSRAVMDAYQAYNTGQYAVAKDLYRTALSSDPENRDALLGLAAIAVREGNYQAAYNHYLKILELNPADPVAKSALVSLQGQSDPMSSKSQLLLLLEKYPNAAYLHYALGNVYAGQQKWPEAQQAYFEAYRNDSTNPNYALNLAVSLDHIGQKKTALKFYEDAIRLARSHPAVFDPSAVNVRLEELRTAAKYQ